MLRHQLVVALVANSLGAVLVRHLALLGRAVMAEQPACVQWPSCGRSSVTRAGGVEVIVGRRTAGTAMVTTPVNREASVARFALGLTTVAFEM